MYKAAEQLIVFLMSHHNIKVEDGGDGGIFVIFFNDPSWDEKRIHKQATALFEDVQWCPEPESHSEKAVVVLNCFYPKI